MSKRLTDRGAKKLKTSEERRVVSDEQVSGLQLRVTRNGAKSWALWYRTRAGQARLMTLGPFKPANTRGDGLTTAEARDRAEDLLARIRLGADPRAEEVAARAAAAAPPAPAALTVAGLMDRCLEKLPLKPKTLKEWRRMAAVDIAPLGTRPAAELTRAEVRQWHMAIVERAPYLGNRAFEVLRRAYTWGAEQDLVMTSPFVGLKRQGAEHRSERVLTTPEIAAVLGALDAIGQRRPAPAREDRPKNAPKTGPGWPAYADATRLLMLTGVRRDMVVGMHRAELEDLDGSDPRWIIPGGFEGRSKSGKAHAVPLTAPAVAIIRRRLEVTHGELLFPVSRRGRLSKLRETAPDVPMTWSSRFVANLQAAAVELLGAPMPRWTIHNLRHTLGTHLREDLKVGREVVSMILGHTQGGPTSTRIYDRSELLPERRAALVAWAAWLDRIRETKRTADVLPMKARA